MELRDLLLILRRWWWLILLPAVAAAAYGVATYHSPATLYSASVRYTAGQPAGLADTVGYDPNYYRWLTSEYIVTGLKDWVRTGSFADRVGAEMASQGTPLAPGALGGALGADNSRSILVVFVTWPDPGQATAILNAASTVLQRDNALVFPQLGGLAAVVQPLDAPSAGPIGTSLRSRLDIPLKTALGLALGLALALAAHYLDPFLRSRRDLEQLGLPVLGEIPRPRR
jgi:capsular polysaccharide biosynthesis protein